MLPFAGFSLANFDTIISKFCLKAKKEKEYSILRQLLYNNTTFKVRKYGSSASRSTVTRRWQAKLSYK
jgi:hypothetical protein